MKSIVIDCSLGISGDMLASALLDLGVPLSLFIDNLANLKIDKDYKLKFKLWFLSIFKLTKLSKKIECGTPKLKKADASISPDIPRLQSIKIDFIYE